MCRNKSKNYNSNYNDITRRILHQSGSSLLLVVNVGCFFPPAVDRVYFWGCVCNAVISIVYHSIQEPITIPCPKKRRFTRFPPPFLVMNRNNNASSSLWDHEWPCSTTKATDKPFSFPWFVKRLDQACVCFVCYYTAANIKNDAAAAAPAASTVLWTCAVAGFVGMPINAVLVFYSLYLTLGSHEFCDVLSGEARALFLFAAVCGTLCFGYLELLGAWCTPYRYIWHSCCACLVGIGAILNTNNNNINEA